MKPNLGHIMEALDSVRTKTQKRTPLKSFDKEDVEEFFKKVTNNLYTHIKKKWPDSRFKLSMLIQEEIKQIIFVFAGEVDEGIRTLVTGWTYNPNRRVSYDLHNFIQKEYDYLSPVKDVLDKDNATNLKKLKKELSSLYNRNYKITMEQNLIKMSFIEDSSYNILVSIKNDYCTLSCTWDNKYNKYIFFTRSLLKRAIAYLDHELMSN